MGKLLNDLQKELNVIKKDIEKQIKKNLTNGVTIAKEATTRVDTGFFKNNWWFDIAIPKEEIKPNATGGIPSRGGLSSKNITKWKLGEQGYIVNNTEYASYHDLGTIHITPLFISFQVETYLQQAMSRIK